MELKELTIKQLKHVLKTHYKQDFPPIERKSARTILKLCSTKKYFCYGTFENNDLITYLFLFKENDVILLDYFAVCGNNKDKGFGGMALELIKETFKDYLIIGEIETPSTNAPNNSQILRRINFYARHNMYLSDVYVSLWGVKMQIITYPKVDRQILLEKLNYYYPRFYGLRNFAKNMKVDIKKD